MLEDVQIAIGKRLGGTVIGDPRVEGVRMGALAGQAQRNEVKRALDELLKGSQIVYGSADSVVPTQASVDAQTQLAALRRREADTLARSSMARLPPRDPSLDGRRGSVAAQRRFTELDAELERLTAVLSDERSAESSAESAARSAARAAAEALEASSSSSDE